MLQIRSHVRAAAALTLSAVVASAALAAGVPAKPAAPAPAAGAVDQAVDLVVTNARVFDGRSAQLRDHAEIAIAGGRIVAIRDAGGAAPAPAGSRPPRG